MQINRKSFGTLKSDRYGRVTVMDEWPLRQVLLYIECMLHKIKDFHKQEFTLILLYWQIAR